MSSKRASFALSTDSIVSVLVAGVFTGAMALIMCVAFGALIFAGALAPLLSHGIALGIVGCVVVGLLGSCFSDARRVVFQPDDDTAPIYALLVATLVGVLATASLQETLAIAVFAILLTTIFSGIALAVLGYFRFGSAVEYLPYSVMGGYFAAAGWLLVLGGIKVVIPDIPDDAAGFFAALREHNLAFGATATMALVIFLLRNHVSSAVLLPGAAALAMIIFYAVGLGSGHSVDSLAEQGWLIGPFPTINADLFHPLISLPLSPQLFIDVISNGEAIAIIVLLSVMSTMLTIGGLGLLSREDLSVDKELKTLGLINVVNGALGGLASFPSLALTSLAAEVGAPKSRWVGISSALFCGLFFLLGLQLLGFIPRLAIGGMLLYLGFGFLHSWLIEARNKYPLHEYLVIPTILIVAASIGFLQGVLVGLLAAVILFVVKYSQVNVVRFEGDGTQFRSNAERSAPEQAFIQQRADRILTMGLQGYLFFGTAGSVYRRLKEYLNTDAEDGQIDLRYIIVDFSHVSGVDASASLNFEKLAQLVTLNQVYLLLAGLPDELRARISSLGGDEQELVYIKFVDDFDFALEWCEQQLLDDYSAGQSSAKPGFLEGLKAAGDSQYDDFISYLKVLDVEAEHVLTAQDDESDQLFFLESCSASAYIYDDSSDSANPTRLRVRRTGRGTIYGEIGFYLHTPRTASIITDEPGRVLILSRSALAEMEREHPALAAAFQNHMLAMVMERLFLTTQTLKTVMR